VSAHVGFGSSQTITDKEHFYCRPNADETAGQYGTLRERLRSLGISCSVRLADAAENEVKVFYFS